MSEQRPPYLPPQPGQQHHPQQWAATPQPQYLPDVRQAGAYPIPPAPQMPVAQVLPKSPGVAVLASFFIPGLGSMISGNAMLGTIILIGYIISWVLTLLLVGIIGVIGFWVWGMIQAHHDAVAWNRAHGILS
ncbi:hypothetical protein [Phaeacidiphilus oryzae]|uniref:hypothetical protein n=1 Tax=Phaeacidiphilus oryzae TaxID=348818 RepID=UPI00068D1224|nr:hypothetical protein [Phaeacidiphilus oryzae]